MDEKFKPSINAEFLVSGDDQKNIEEQMMKKNIGDIERIVRVVVGAIIISLAFWGLKTPWAYLGIIPIATGLSGWCPPYAMLGISTCKVK